MCVCVCVCDSVSHILNTIVVDYFTQYFQIVSVGRKYFIDILYIYIQRVPRTPQKSISAVDRLISSSTSNLSTLSSYQTIMLETKKSAALYTLVIIIVVCLES